MITSDAMIWLHGISSSDINVVANDVGVKREFKCGSIGVSTRKYLQLKY